MTQNPGIKYQEINATPAARHKFWQVIHESTKTLFGQIQWVNAVGCYCFFPLPAYYGYSSHYKEQIHNFCLARTRFEEKVSEEKK